MGPANSVPNTLKVCEATPADLPRVERSAPAVKRESKVGPSPQTPGPSPYWQEYYLERPWFFLAPGSFWKSTFWQGFPPCPPGHLPPKTECAGVLI